MEKWLSMPKHVENGHFYTNEEILQTGDALVWALKELPAFVMFQQSEAKLKEHPRANALLREMRTLQKELVNLKHLGKTNAYEQKSEQLKKCEEELYSIPLVNTFLAAQEEVNHWFQRISTEISFVIQDQMKR